MSARLSFGSGCWGEPEFQVTQKDQLPRQSVVYPVPCPPARLGFQGSFATPRKLKSLPVTKRILQGRLLECSIPADANQGEIIFLGGTFDSLVQQKRNFHSTTANFHTATASSAKHPKSKLRKSSGLPGLLPWQGNIGEVDVLHLVHCELTYLKNICQYHRGTTVMPAYSVVSHLQESATL